MDFLTSVAVPQGDDLGFAEFMDRVDAVLMGRVTYQTVLGFGVPWPYAKPVFVYTSTGTDVPSDLVGRVETISGAEEEVLRNLHSWGFRDIYVDGGSVIRSFLEKNLIDEMIISRIPVLLGGGTPLFGDLPRHLDFKLVSSDTLVDQIVRCRYLRRH